MAGLVVDRQCPGEVEVCAGAVRPGVCEECGTKCGAPECPGFDVDGSLEAPTPAADKLGHEALRLAEQQLEVLVDHGGELGLGDSGRECESRAIREVFPTSTSTSPSNDGTSLSRLCSATPSVSVGRTSPSSSPMHYTPKPRIHDEPRDYRRVEGALAGEPTMNGRVLSGSTGTTGGLASVSGSEVSS